jgi:hypothetical protein
MSTGHYYVLVENLCFKNSIHASVVTAKQKDLYLLVRCGWDSRLALFIHLFDKVTINSAEVTCREQLTEHTSRLKQADTSLYCMWSSLIVLKDGVRELGSHSYFNDKVLRTVLPAEVSS